MSELDKDFEETVAKINAKVQEAAAALREAAKLADKAGYDGLILTQWVQEKMKLPKGATSEEWDEAYYKLEEKYNLINVNELERAMGECGWSASSSYC